MGNFFSNQTQDLTFDAADIINDELFKKAAEEYTQTVERLHNKYMRPCPGGCCTAAEQRLQDCYVNNKDKTLVCSKLVSDYAQCVQNFIKADAARHKAEVPA